MEPILILVDEQNNITGYEKKLKVHQDGLLHRAFSIFVMNKKGQLMLQKRAIEKYHSGGLWTNAVCSHPKAGEDVKVAAIRRMNQEMGFECDIDEVFSFLYKANVGDNLTEHEFDHVFVGYSDTKPKPNPEEVEDWKYVSMEWLVKDVEENPQDYTVWFVIALKELLKHVDLVKQ